MNLNLIAAWLMLVSLSAGACGGEWTDELPLGQVSVDLEQPVLDFANDGQRTTFERLHTHCGVRKDAATNITLHRDGPDGLFGTPDDDLFQSVQELDDLSRVGPAALSRLWWCAHKFGYLIPRDHACTPRLLGESAPQVRQIIHAIDDLTDDLAAVVSHLQGEAVTWGDPGGQPARFMSVLITSTKGAPVRYEVMFAQVINLADGTAARIVYTLDSCFGQLSVGVTYGASGEQPGLVD